jgi:hypothetical protein
MPVCNTPETLLREAIDSVLGQIYPHWELCVADDASIEGHAIDLEDYARRDTRIPRWFPRAERPHQRSYQFGIRACLRRLGRAFTMTTCYVRIRWPRSRSQSPHIRTHGIYSDEDKLDADGLLATILFQT